MSERVRVRVRVRVKHTQDSMDVSADLTELGRTPIAVVCAGAKSILEIPRTLEVLETQVAALLCTDGLCRACLACRAACSLLRMDEVNGSCAAAPEPPPQTPPHTCDH